MPFVEAYKLIPFLSLLKGTISVTYSNPVSTVAQYNDLVTEASPSLTTQDPEAEIIEKVETKEYTDAPMSPNGEEDEQLSTIASPAEDSDDVKASQSEAMSTDAPLSPSEEQSSLSTVAYTNLAEN